MGKKMDKNFGILLPWKGLGGYSVRGGNSATLKEAKYAGNSRINDGWNLGIGIDINRGGEHY